MLEITSKELLELDNVNRAKMLKEIASGAVKFVPEEIIEKNYNHIPRID